VNPNDWSTLFHQSKMSQNHREKMKQSEDMIKQDKKKPRKKQSGGKKEGTRGVERKIH
jgi:hypothetical protein